MEILHNPGVAVGVGAVASTGGARTPGDLLEAARLNGWDLGETIYLNAWHDVDGYGEGDEGYRYGEN